MKDRKKLTYFEAVELLPDTERISVMKLIAPFVLIGRSFSKLEVLEMIYHCDEDVELSGEIFISMGHGIALTKFDKGIFIETNDEKLCKYTIL